MMIEMWTRDWTVYTNHDERLLPANTFKACAIAVTVLPHRCRSPELHCGKSVVVLVSGLEPGVVIVLAPSASKYKIHPSTFAATAEGKIALEIKVLAFVSRIKQSTTALLDSEEDSTVWTPDMLQPYLAGCKAAWNGVRAFGGS